MRSLEAADRLLDAGATRVILGTDARARPRFRPGGHGEVRPRCPGCRHRRERAGEAAVAGWTEGSGVAAADLALPHGVRWGTSTSSTPTLPATACRPAWRTTLLREDGRRLRQPGHRFRRHCHRG
ncbi:MAG: hypothetical protein ACLTDR_07745 [Adlercreutzia equolifaciens]